MLKKSSSAIIGLFGEELMRIVPVLFLGNFADDKINSLGALALGNMMITIIIRSVSLGLIGGIEKMVAQAYGDRQYYLWGLHLNRALLVNTLLFIIQIFLLSFSRSIMEGLGLEEELIALSESYIFFMLPGMYCKIQFETIRWYLQGQRILGITAKIVFPGAILHALLTYSLVFSFKLGIEGVGIASSVVSVLSLGILWRYLSKNRYTLLHPNAWHFFNKDAFKNWGEYIKNGSPTAVMKCVDMWSFQSLLLFMSWLGKTELAAYSWIIATTSFLFQIPTGVGSSAITLVGNALSSNHAVKASKYANVAIATGMISGVICGLSFLFFGQVIAEAFTDEQDIISNITKLVPLIAIHELVDHTQQAECGVLKAMGYYRYGSITLLIWMLFIGVPTSYYLAFVQDLTTIGAYSGMVVAIGITAFLFTTNLWFFVDWSKVSYEAVRRTEVAKKRELDMVLI